MVQASCFFADDRLWLGTWKNVNLMLWRGHVTPQHLDKMRDYYANLSKVTPKWHALSIISSDRLPKIGPTERERIRELSVMSLPHLLSMAQVVEGTGRWAAAVRALLLGVNTMSKAPSSVFSLEQAACEWMAKRGLEDPHGLAEAVAETRREWAKVQPAA